jgi:hypothetical protein
MNLWERQVLRTSQVLIVAMLAATVMLAIVGVAIGPVAPRLPGTSGGTSLLPAPLAGIDPMLLFLGALLVAQLPVLVVLGVKFRKQAAMLAAEQSDDRDRRDRALTTIWQISMIFRAALAEAAGLMGGMIVLLHGERLGLAGVAIAVIVLLALMPTRGKLENWIQRAVQDAALLREHPRQ